MARYWPFFLSFFLFVFSFMSVYAPRPSIFTWCMYKKKRMKELRQNPAIPKEAWIGQTTRLSSF